MAKLPPPDDDDEIVDVAAFLSDPARKPPSPPPAPRPIPSGDEYAVEGLEPDDAPPVSPVPRAPIAPPRPKKPSAPIFEDDEPKPRRQVDDDPRVTQVWSRGAEWGTTLIVLMITGVILLYVSYSMIVSSGGIGFLVLFLGGIAWVALTYPIAVTLERPVRMTPEQAVKDYYAALSHRFPHFKRAWLLLSDEGKTNREFSSYPEFRAAWKRRMAELRGSAVKGTTPLSFDVVDFKAEKSAGLTSIDAKFTVNVRARGETGAPIASPRIATTLAKGPDNQWYLDSGVLPRDTHSS